MKYYLQIVKDNVSILADSDIGYYHQFKIDDVIEVVMSDDLGVSLNVRTLNTKLCLQYLDDGWIIQNPKFTIDWDKKDYQHLSIASSVMNGYMIDITKGVERNKKLEQLGI
jgi:hypothetical protein